MYPLHAAAELGDAQLVRMLLAAGADPEQRTGQGLVIECLAIFKAELLRDAFAHSLESRHSSRLPELSACPCRTHHGYKAIDYAWTYDVNGSHTGASRL